MEMEPLLRLEHISKAFSGVPALEDVSLQVFRGEVHALVGENGAGKSTLMNITSGVLPADAGRIYWEGKPVSVQSPRQAQELGISFVHQELALVPQLSAGENIFLGRHPCRRAGFHWVRWDEIHQRAGALLEELGHKLDPRRPVAELSVGEQQLVEIGRALSLRARLVIMDEATAPLSGHETARLFEVIGRLKQRGVSVIYITHRLREIYQGPDRVTVLRDGRRVASAPVAEMPPDALVEHMVGRPAKEQFPALKSCVQAGEALRVEGFSVRGKIHDISLRVHRGEIVGLAGLAGAGRTEFLEALFGAAARSAGRVFVEGRPVNIRAPADAIRHGMALVPDDRKAKGLIPEASVRCNMVLASERQLRIHAGRETEKTGRMVRELRVRTTGPEQPVVRLSGGNQQKVVLAKWLLANARIFLLDEPTRGIDVGAKAETYDIIRRLAARGAAIVLASSELEELLHLADRVLVMHRGRIAGELARGEASEASIMRLATGGSVR